MAESLPLTDEQRHAVERRDGALLVRAGAGTGKTSVLVERFVQAVVAGEADVEGILAITFTEKAAAEMKARVRRRFLDLGRREEARAAEGAWISTIHGLCSRVLRAHALAAGIDPGFRVLDELEAERLGMVAFDQAVADLLAEGDPERLDTVAAYTPDRLRDMVRSAYSKLRSRGQRRPSLPATSPPVSSGEASRLEAAARAALRHLGACDRGKAVEDAMGRLEECLELLDRTGAAPAEPADLRRLSLRWGGRVLEGDECDAYRGALEEYSRLCLATREQRVHELVRRLLDLYAGHYQRLKAARSGLDFEDLELVARDLLRDDPGIADQYARRFAQVLVDEFQDTNELQNELLSLLERDNLFRVGDENQSIYGFRHADVDVFRGHHARAAGEGRAVSVAVNFRSRREILDAVDVAFSQALGDGFEPLRAAPAASRRPPRVDPCVELLVVDKSAARWGQRLGDDDPLGASMRGAPLWRACEARLLARRIDELTGGGRYSHGDVVLLLRATTSMGFYERALEERGIPTHVVGGRGFFGQQQVGDLRHWLAALANPMDELALYSVLASPLAGVSLDALALVSVHADGGNAWWTLREPPTELADALPPVDRDRIERFVSLFEGERRGAPRRSLETLIDRAVTLTGYDVRVLAMPAGERRMANVRKLMRMAREYEAEEGRELRGFIDFVAERDMIQEREGEAALEAEGIDAVRIMTIHRAKGLEFEVVCVGDLGKDGREDHGALRVSPDGLTGIRLVSLSGGAVKSERLAELEREERERSEAEERRILYVAATRAKEHLVLSGATDLEKRSEPKPLSEPMRWLLPALCPRLPAEGAVGIATGEWEGREVRVRVERCTPATVDELLPRADRRPTAPPRPEAPAGGTPTLSLGTIPAPRALPVSRLSYSGLEAYKRCAYRFYLERALRLPGGDALRLRAPGGVTAALELDAGRAVAGEDGGAPEPRAADELPALLRGTIAHELLERIDFGRPAIPGEDEIAGRIRAHGAPVREADVADLRELIAGFPSSPVCERLARCARVRTELPFAFSLSAGQGERSLLVTGVVDVLARERERTLIVDYKSDRLEGEDPRELCERNYSTQRLVYALAGLRAGAQAVEVGHLFLERPAEPVAVTFTAPDDERLESDLRRLARGIAASSFAPTDLPGPELCSTCPGQPGLCSWGPERTLGGA
jgi:ATP-dependent helicase/nuclease subunit A